MIIGRIYPINHSNESVLDYNVKEPIQILNRLFLLGLLIKKQSLSSFPIPQT